MNKKILTGILVGLMSASMTSAVGCSIYEGKESTGNPQQDVWSIERVYATAQELGFEGSLEDLIALFKGDPGQDGVGIKSI